MRELGGKEMAGQAWNLEQRGESEVVAVTAGPWAGTALLVRQLEIGRASCRERVSSPV